MYNDAFFNREPRESYAATFHHIFRVMGEVGGLVEGF